MNFTRVFMWSLIVAVFLGGNSVFAFPERSGGKDNSVVVDLRDNDELFYYDSNVYDYADAKIYFKSVLEKELNDLTRDILRKTVQNMILDFVLYDEAMEKDPEMANIPEIMASLNKFRIPYLKELYYSKEIVPNVKVTLDEYADTLPLPKVQYEISVIVAEEQSKINEIYKRIENGEEFQVVAKKYSEGITASKGGRLGLLGDEGGNLFTKMEFQSIIKTPEGKSSRPFSTRIGWVIAHVDKVWNPVILRRKQAEGSFGEYRRQKEREYFEVRMEKAKENATIQVDNDLLQEIQKRIAEKTPLSGDTLSREIASVNGKVIYAGEVVQFLARHGDESLETFLEKRIFDEIVAQEAERIRLSSEGFEKAFRFKKAHEIGRKYLDRIASARLSVTEKDIRAYYEDNPDQFAVPETRRIFVIELSDPRKADEAMSRLRKGRDFREVAEEFNVGEEARKRKGDLGYLAQASLVEEVGTSAFAAKRGATVGPLKVGLPDGEWIVVILFVEDIRPAGKVPFGAVNTKLIEGRVSARKRAGFYEDILADLGGKHGIRYSENLKEGAN